MREEQHLWTVIGKKDLCLRQALPLRSKRLFLRKGVGIIGFLERR